MITGRAVPAPLPAQITVSQISSATVSRDFADPLVGYPGLYDSSNGVKF